MSVNFQNFRTFNRFYDKSGTSSVQTYEQKQQETRPIASVKVGDVVQDSNTDKNGHKKLFGIIGISVGSVALLSLIAFFTLSKGFSAGFAKKVAKLSEKIKQTIAELSSKPKDLTPFQKLKLKVTKAIDPVADGMEACANITAIKDSFTNKVLQKMKLQKFVDAINKFFKDKIVLKTKNNAYKKAELSVVEYCNYLESLAHKENNPEFAKKAKEIMSAYANKFSVKAHVSRSNENWEKMNGLSDKVFDKLFRYNGTIKEKGNQFINNIKGLKSYITTDLTEAQRIELKKELGSSQENLVSAMKSSLNLLSGAQKAEAQKLFTSADTRLGKAIASEIKSFNKLAEIQVGSVATDILGILTPSAIATGLIINSENKNERIGTTLTKGIPIFGGLGASYYGATRGFTGAKNLGLGLSTALLLNIIGTKANEWYKKYAEKQNLLAKTFEAFNKLQSNEKQ